MNGHGDDFAFAGFAENMMAPADALKRPTGIF
jgi:hypothetical protein